MLKKFCPRINVGIHSQRTFTVKTQANPSPTQTITKVDVRSPYFQVGYAPFTSELEIKDTRDSEQFPVFRCLDENGKPVDSNFIQPVSDDEAIKMYETMVIQRRFDDVFYKLARMNLISFYIQNVGEEATAIGSIAAMSNDDIIFSQYRELGAFLYRGFSLQDCADLNFSNDRDINCGRQMPVHYGSKKLNMVTVSSTLATQMPQAAGASYGVKRKGNNNCVLCYFGEGAASEGDAMVSFNMSATLSTPILWYCRNNAYAISTPSIDQYCGDGIISRAFGYGMYGLRFDGNDIFASYIATKEARNLCINESRPIVLEAMTYRGSHHSTSDDSKTYRNAKEEETWNTTYNPIIKMQKYLRYVGLWNDNKEIELIEKAENLVDDARERAEVCPKPHWKHLYSDVYDEVHPRLQKQMDEMEQHLDKYGNEEYYKMHDYSQDFNRQCPH